MLAYHATSSIHVPRDLPPPSRVADHRLDSSRKCTLDSPRHWHRPRWRGNDPQLPVHSDIHNRRFHPSRCFWCVRYASSVLIRRRRILASACSTAIAAVTFFRSVAACVFPLFAPAMYNALGYGKGDTILACAAVAIGGPSYVPFSDPWYEILKWLLGRPILFWLYGERIRKASRYARHT